MFGFGKKENAERKAFREEFESTTSRLRTADKVVQMAVGHSINMASSLFHQAYTTPRDFQRLPTAEKFSYIAKLTNMEEKLRDENNDMASSIGFGLFKMWVGAVTQDDKELIQQFAAELAHFSKIGDMSRVMPQSRDAL